MADEGEMKFSDYVETMLDPRQHDYAASKFEKFMKETMNCVCPGCGETGLYEYIILDAVRGVMMCPKCKQRTDLKTVMRGWLAITGDSDTVH